MNPPSGISRCAHYKRRCKIRAPCCGEVFGCRHCHNEAKVRCFLLNPFGRCLFSIELRLCNNPIELCLGRSGFGFGANKGKSLNHRACLCVAEFAPGRAPPPARDPSPRNKKGVQLYSCFQHPFTFFVISASVFYCIPSIFFFLYSASAVEFIPISHLRNQ